MALHNDIQGGTLPFITAELNDLAPTQEKPRTYAFDPPAGEPKSTALPQAVQVQIADGRPIRDRFSLDRAGFALVDQHTKGSTPDLD